MSIMSNPFVPLATGIFRALVLGGLLVATAASATDALPAGPAALLPGDYRWHPESAPKGPIVVVVSLDEQRVYVYRNGIAIGISTVSSGRKGHVTPTGVFTILQKEREHYSNKYDNAPMPFMERLTWDGIAMHGGKLPGYPASHGCVRLPQGFAERLFAITQPGETVVVADALGASPDIVHPAVLAPVSVLGAPLAGNGSSDAAYTWDDAAPSQGPVSILVSLLDRRVYVLRNGIRIGASVLEIKGDFTFFGSVVFVMMQGTEEAPSPLDPAQKRHRWTMYPVRGEAGGTSMETLASHLKLPEEFSRRVYAILEPGTSILVTDLPAIRAVAAAPSQTVLESDAGESGTLNPVR
ncbi:MAG: L,D-transpeptidase [Dokdonella sp.]